MTTMTMTDLSDKEFISVCRQQMRSYGQLPKHMAAELIERFSKTLGSIDTPQQLSFDFGERG